MGSRPFGVNPVHRFCGHFKRNGPQESSLAQSARAVSVLDTDSNSDVVHTTQHHEVQQETAPDDECSAVRRRFVPPRMVAGVRKAAPRKFSVKQMLRKNKFVYNVRKASEEVVKILMQQTQCSNAELEFELKGKTCAQIRRELRKSLAEALRSHADKLAFAKELGTDARPRADELEKMVAAFPGLDQINWDAKPVESGINCGLWKAWHARHCKACTPTVIHRECYFRVIHHFLKTGFDAPEDMQARNQRPEGEAPTAPRAYVNKWRHEEARCEKAYDKWVNECENLMSDLCDVWPEFFSPLLPVARAKDKWRWKNVGKDYKIRLCLDLKCSGYNGNLLDWLFRYCGIDTIAENIKQGDWMAALDISRFYLRLPAGERLKRAQWFQDPSTYAKTKHNNERRAKAKLKFRQLLAVAFGLKSAPAWASLVSGELCRILRSFDIDVAGVYIDDILIRAITKELCMQHKQLAEEIATALGLPFNEKTLGPSQNIAFLGCEIDSTDCTIRVSAEYRKYALSRVQEVLRSTLVSLSTLESLAGMLTWIAHVYDSGKPRRKMLYRRISQMKARGENQTVIRGDLRSQLKWWFHSLARETKMMSKFWAMQPDTPLVCSDASGDDGWGCCTMGLHIVGCWPRAWRQSCGTRKVGMLFKEVVPPALTTMLLAPLLQHQVLCAAMDNAGAAFSVNRLSSANCDLTMELMKPLSDSLSHGRCALLAGHAHRQHNAHTDMLSHALPDRLWSQVVSQANEKRRHRMEFHFAVLDVETAECYLATMSIKDPFFGRSSHLDAHGVEP